MEAVDMITIHEEYTEYLTDPQRTEFVISCPISHYHKLGEILETIGVDMETRLWSPEYALKEKSETCTIRVEKEDVHIFRAVVGLINGSVKKPSKHTGYRVVAWNEERFSITFAACCDFHAKKLRDYGLIIASKDMLRTEETYYDLTVNYAYDYWEVFSHIEKGGFTSKDEGPKKKNRYRYLRSTKNGNLTTIWLHTDDPEVVNWLSMYASVRILPQVDAIAATFSSSYIDFKEFMIALRREFNEDEIE